MEMRKLLMDTLCQQGLFIVVELLLGYSHCEGNGVYSMIEKSVKDWAYTIYNWVFLFLICYYR